MRDGDAVGKLSCHAMTFGGDCPTTHSLVRSHVGISLHRANCCFSSLQSYTKFSCTEFHHAEMPCCLEKNFKFTAPAPGVRTRSNISAPLYNAHREHQSTAPLQLHTPTSSCRGPGHHPALVAMSVGLLGSAHVQHLLPSHSFIHVRFDDAVVSRRRSLPIHQALAARARVRPERAVFLLLQERCMRPCTSGVRNHQRQGQALPPFRHC